MKDAKNHLADELKPNQYVPYEEAEHVMHVLIWSVFHSCINKASCALGFPSNVVTLKGISRQAIWLPYFILNYLADASNEMRSIVAERRGEREQNSFFGITIKLCYFF